MALKEARRNTRGQVLFASLVGTTVEFFDFYIYATAAVLVFPKLFFPTGDATAATLASLATFAVAFVARPIGAAIFGHFGDRLGRKATLVLALGTMGLSTFLVGALPTYKAVGLAAPVLLALCRFGQGIGLGGEWGGAVLLATENAPEGKRAWYGMFPQLGAPVGFFLSSAVFLLLGRVLTPAQFLSFGWRLPFLASSVLVLLGLYVRLTIEETPVFRAVVERGTALRVPMLHVVRGHAGALVAGTLASLATFVLFYLMIVFTLGWAVSALHYERGEFLAMQLVGVAFFALAIPAAALLAERKRKAVMLTVSVLIALYGCVFARLFAAGHASAQWMLVLGLTLMGLTYGPLGTVLSELFPPEVRYSGSSLAFSLAGILGASLTPYLATRLATAYGLRSVGWYLSAAAVLSVLGLLGVRQGRGEEFVAAAEI